MIPSTNAAAPKPQPAPKADTKPVDQQPADAKPVDQKPAGQAPAQQAQAPAAPAQPAQNDAFDAHATPAQPTQRNQGDTFDQKSGGGLGDTLLDAAKSVVKPIADAVAPVVKPIADAVAPVVAPIANAVGSIGSAIGGAIGSFAGRIDDIWGQKDVIAKLADIGQPGVLADAINPPDKNNPTEGMTADQQKAYDALPPDQQQQYNDLHSQAAETWRYRTVGPEAIIATPSSSVDHLREALTSGKLTDYLKVEDALKGPEQAGHLKDMRELLFTGKLTDGKINRDFDSTLGAMVDLAKGGTTEIGVDRTKLLGQLAHDLNHPEQIRQGTGNKDCGGTTAAFVMALTQPADYAKMISGLGEKGQVQLTPEWAQYFGAKSNEMKVNGKFDPNDTSRSVTQQLFAKTFDQEAVNGQQPVTAPGQATQAAVAGITGDQLKNGLNDKGILSGGWDAAYMPPANEPGKPQVVNDEQRAQAQKAAEDMINGAKPTEPIMVNVNNHWVTVLGHDKEGNFYVKDPMGIDVRQVSMKDLTEGLNSVVYQSRNVDKNPPPELMHNTEWAKPGGGGSGSGGFGSGGGGSGTRTGG